MELNPETCSLEAFAKYIDTRTDRETLDRYEAIIEARRARLFFIDDMAAQAYDDAQAEKAERALLKVGA